MRSLRKRSLSSGWYPASKAETIKKIESFSKEKIKFNAVKGGKYGGVIPHAGWYYSGGLAAAVMHSLVRTEPELVLLFGGHLSSEETPVITIAGEWETPLGSMKMETEISAKIMEKFSLKDDIYPDNTLEIQLPLIKYYFPAAKLLALRLPASMEAAKLSENIINIIQNTYKKYIVLASTDLTHYGDNYNFIPAGRGKKTLDWVRSNDKGFIDLALKLKTEELLEYAEKNQSACSSGAVAGLTSAAGILGAKKGELLGYKTSYETTPSDSFVGYAGIVF
ncbi:MAG: AmmeMemoRadiSam system protein B [Candidatus Firestonebacteria bacterium]